ncbi:MAG: DMT family transporter [Oligoflexia bacterium]|nr:DMT family transporter [Oligoflexia bacterium]
MNTQIRNKKFLSTVGLFAAMVAWGSSFFIVKMLTAKFGVEAFLFWRFTLGCGTLLLLFGRRIIRSPKALILDGTLLGGFLFFLILLQTLGLQWTTASKSGFITALYVPLMPFGALLLLKQRLELRSVMVALVAFIGLYLLTGSSTPTWAGGINRGDILTLFGSILCVAHILFTEKLSRRHSDSLSLGFWQFFGAWVGSFFVYVLIDLPRPAEFVASSLDVTSLLWMIYVTLGPTVFSFIMQIVCQKEIGNLKAALIFALEAPFAAFFAMIFLHESLNSLEALGGLIIFLTSVIPESWLLNQKKA